MSVLSEPRFTQPPHLTWGSMCNSMGQTIRTAFANVSSPRAVVLLLTGLSEFTEKYFETIYDLNARGFDVVTFDWFSQGGSARGLPNEPYKIHVKDFDDYLGDLTNFIKSNINDRPFYIVAHSMGGHLALRHLMNHSTSTCLGAVLSAPMIDIRQSNFVPRFLRDFLLKQIAKSPSDYAPGAKDWSTDTRNAPAGQSEFSSDPKRDSLHREWILKTPLLRTGGPTGAWVCAALHSIDCLKTDISNGKLKTPILAHLAGNDLVVSTRIAQDTLSPHADLVILDGAKHEILMEKDEFRRIFWDNFDGFVERYPPPVV